MSIQDRPIGEVIENARYFVYGFGIACGFIVLLLGYIFRLLSEKIRQAGEDRKCITEIKTQLLVMQHDISSIQNAEGGHDRFSEGIASVSEKLTSFKSEMKTEVASMKEDIGDLKWKCEYRHFPELARERKKERDRQ